MDRKGLTYLLIVIPALLCLLIYFADYEVKKSLTLIPAKYTLTTMYTTNFVHYTFDHLAGNLFYYILLSILSFQIYSKLGFAKLFQISFLLILLAVPLASSLFTIELLPQVLQDKPSCGFSGVVSAVIGLYGFSISLYLIKLKANDTLAFLSVLILGLSLVPFVYNCLIHGMILLTLSIFTFAYLMKNVRIGKKDVIFIFLTLFIYLLSIISIFPQQIVQGSNVANIIAHYAGFMFGYLIPWFGRFEG